MYRILTRSTAAAITATAAWQFYVYTERIVPRMTPQHTWFYVNSTDDQVMDSLRTGDVLLFRRNCVLTTPIKSLVCICEQMLEEPPSSSSQNNARPWEMAEKQWSAEASETTEHADTFDHCGIIIASHIGVPLVLELGEHGPKVTPYDLRIIKSHDHEIVLRRIDFERTPDFEQSAAEFAKQCVQNVQKSSTKNYFQNDTVYVGTISEFQRFTDAISALLINRCRRFQQYAKTFIKKKENVSNPNPTQNDNGQNPNPTHNPNSPKRKNLSCSTISKISNPNEISKWSNPSAMFLLYFLNNVELLHLENEKNNDTTNPNPSLHVKVFDIVHRNIKLSNNATWRKGEFVIRHR